MREPLLLVHVVAGLSGLVLGPLAVVVRARGSRRPYLARGYLVSVTLVSATALGLIAVRPQMWWLGPVAVAATAAAWAGARAGGRAGPHAHSWPMRCTGGSYVALVTAAAVVNIGSPVAWVLPTVAGTVLIELAAHRQGFRAVRGSAPIAPDDGHQLVSDRPR